MPATSSANITNIIVVMLENRSYDNMLGGLYSPGYAAPYNQAPLGQANLNGLTLSGSNQNSNPNPNPPPSDLLVSNQTAPTEDPNTGATYPATTIPIFDPGEPFDDMAQQILGLSSKPSSNPYASWPPASTTLMQGFANNYAGQSFVSKVPAANIPDIMNYFNPAQVPVTAWLATNFAVCDQWFASVPTQTFTNRAFAHCAAPAVKSDGSASLIDDAQYFESLLSLPSVFSQFDAVFPPKTGAPQNWKVYFHDYSISMLTVPYVMAQALSKTNVNVATFDNTDWGSGTPEPITNILTGGQTALGAVPATFLEDLSNGTLPKYSFIEPRYSSNKMANAPLAPNCNHPGTSEYVDPIHSESNPPIDVADGEAFLAQIYNALQSSSYWDTTLLIVTYDEHGGLYDHVVPPVATSPGQTTGSSPITIPAASDFLDSASDGFTFNVFGCRVPAIIVARNIAAGSTISPPAGSAPFDHTSIIKTVWECFDLTSSSPQIGSLTARDANAPSLLGSLDETVDNNPGQYTSAT